MRISRFLATLAAAALLASPALGAEPQSRFEPSPLLEGWAGPCPPCSASAGLVTASSPGTLMPTGGSAFGALGAYGIAGSALQPSQPETACPPASGCPCGCCGCTGD